MNASPTSRIFQPAGAPPTQRGFTLVELMIAITIGLFLIGGLVTLTGAMKRTSSLQGDLGQLHDTERMAFSLMTDVIQSSGYYASPIGTNSPTAEFPATGVFAAAGQAIYGVDGGTGAAPTSTVTVRYTSTPGDGVLNCIGATYQVDGAGDLQCVLSTTISGTTTVQTTNIATGVQWMKVLYGVQSVAASGTYSIDSYLTATQVSAGPYWPNVISVQVTLMFVNPMYCAGANCKAGQQSTQPPYITLTRTIALMNKAGVNT
jgi:type IV pilus assembly protein PilW